MFAEKFEDRSDTIYRGMQGRIGERRDGQNRITRIGRSLPFSRAEFRAWPDPRLRCLPLRLCLRSSIPHLQQSPYGNEQAFSINYSV